MEKINCFSCEAELGERNQSSVWPGSDVQVLIKSGMVYFFCPKCLKEVEIGKSEDIKYLFRPGCKRIY